MTTQCGICLENVDLLTTIQCLGGHAICKDCVQHLFEMAIKMYGSVAPKCCGSALPITTCAVVLRSDTVGDIQRILKSNRESAGKEDDEIDEADQAFVRDSIKRGQM